MTTIVVSNTRAGSSVPRAFGIEWGNCGNALEMARRCLVPEEELSLGEFVEQLAVRMKQQGVVMLFRDDTPWHLLFYKLKRETRAPGRPAFLDSLRFDWDGPYPKSQQLADFIQALHWTGSLGAVNPSYEELVLQEDVSALWAAFGESLPKETRGFLEHATTLAKDLFPAQ